MYRRPLRRACLLVCALTAVPLAPALAAPTIHLAAVSASDQAEVSGYCPAAAPYDGSKLVYCSGATFNAILSNGLGMTCDMTGGASGGGWFLRFSEATGAGILNSVNSYKINLVSFWMFGPYFGADAQRLYNSAQSA